MKLTMQLKSRSYDIILKAGCLANLHQFTNVENRRDFVLCVLLVVVLSRSPWSPFSTARVKRRGKTGRGPDARESVCSVHTWLGLRASVVTGRRATDPS